jgi:rRNA-processing protein FCF1
MPVRLALGVEPAEAIRVVRDITGNMSAAIGATSEHPVDKRNDYVRWATHTEARLESVLRRDDARAFLDTPRHRDISSSSVGEHLTMMIYAELNAKQRDFQEAASYLQYHLDRMRRAPGLPIVVDSNVLIHSQRPDYVNWMEELKSEARVMLPLRVIEEIDAKKYSDSKRLRAHARRLLPWINGLFPEGDLGPVRLRNDATIELLLAERPRYRPADADDEVLDACHAVVRFAGTGRLMTADTAMRLRAMTEGLEVFFLPPERPRDAAESDSA